MKNNLIICVLIFIVSIFTSHIIHAAEKVHHHGQSEDKLSLNLGDKWAIDKSLHLGMTSIKSEIANNLQYIHQEQFSNKQYTALAAKLDKHLSFIFKNCKLPPLADAQLHTLLTKIIQGADKIKHSTQKKQGAVLIIQALHDYPVFFEDPDWQNIVH